MICEARLFYEEDINIRTQELRQTIPAKLGAFHRLHRGSKYPNIQRNEATWPGDNIQCGASNDAYPKVREDFTITEKGFLRDCEIFGYVRIGIV